jgi:hypothetical protein
LDHEQIETYFSEIFGNWYNQTLYCVCKIKVNDAFILIYNLTLSHDYDNKQYFNLIVSKTYTR